MTQLSDLDILIGALTVHGEARGCTQEGRTAIAHSILNRMKAKAWWGKSTQGYPANSMAAVCLYPWQYSCWNANDPNSTLLRSLQARYREAIKEKTCRAALKAVIDAADGYLSDPTGGATHYLTIQLHKSPKCPEWAQGNNKFIEIGQHRFFAGIR